MYGIARQCPKIINSMPIAFVTSMDVFLLFIVICKYAAKLQKTFHISKFIVKE